MTWRGLRRRLVEVLMRVQVDREAREELRLHVEEAVAARVAAGMPEEDARRRVALELGRIDVARERLAEERTGVAAEQVWRELSHASRVLRRSPGLTLLSVATIGVGIGLTTTVFALVNAVVLRPLPYPAPDRLVRVVDTNAQAGVDRAGVASGNVYEWRRRTDGFDGIAGYYVMGRTISGDGPAEVVLAAQVTHDFFAVAGISPIVGRAFTAAETDRATFSPAAAPTGADPVVILSHALWTSRFGSDPDVLGRTIEIERRPFVVVGVMPPAFRLPDAGVQIWIPWQLSADHPHDQHYLGGIARLSAGVSREDAEARLARVATALEQEFPESNQGWGVRLIPLRDDAIGAAATVLWAVSGAAGLLLVVACANVALLALMRGLDRANETAVRAALGASPRRLLREFLLESLLLAVCGGALGTALALTALRVLPSVVTDVPRLDEVRFDWQVLAFVAGATLLAAVGSGLPQAVRRLRLPVLAALTDGTARITNGRRLRAHDVMVVAQVAMAVVLLIGSGLLMQSVRRLARVDSGFDPRGVLVLPVFLDSQAYRTGEHSRTYYGTLFERLSAVPGILSAGGATTVPTSPLGPDFERPVWPQGTLPAPADRTPAAVRVVTPGYFAAMGMPLSAGRGFDERDQPASPPVLIVNESLARRLWPGQSPVGRQLVVDYSTNGTFPYEIVGVLTDTRFRGPRSEPGPEVYFPHAQKPYLVMNVVVKTAGDSRLLIPAVRSVLREMDPQKPAHAATALEDLLGATYARDREAMATLLVFAVAAILLALLSVYGVLAQRVRVGAREIGIRMAFGADATGLAWWVTAAGLRLVLAGVTLGVGAALALSGAVQGLLYGVAATDLMTIVTIGAAVLAVGFAAALPPAWRATRIDPVAVLRRG
jgi:putative ABC transport system permease protein